MRNKNKNVMILQNSLAMRKKRVYTYLLKKEVSFWRRTMNKVVLITGGVRNSGWAMAQKFASE